MGKTLLLADDSVTIQKVVGISFASEDISITTVDNGDDAISKAREIRPDVILADVVMPGKSGYEVCESIKSDPELRHIPVLLLTGTFEAFDEDRAARAGASGHVAKPFEAATLVERVKELLAQPPTQAAIVEVAPEPIEEAPLASPATSGADNAFDFFDDAGPSDSSAERAELEIDGTGDAFAFDEDEFGAATDVVPDRGTPPEPAAHTVAILPDEPAHDSPSFSDEDLEPLAPEALGQALDPAPPPVPQAASGDGFDFEFEGVRSEPAADDDLASEGLAESMLLDPSGDDAFDVSSSQLGDLSVPPPAVASSPVAEPVAATQLLSTPEPVEPRRSLAELGMPPSVPSGDADPIMEMLSVDPVDSGLPEPSDDFVEEVPTGAPARAMDPMALDAPEEVTNPQAAAWPEPDPSELEDPEPSRHEEPLIELGDTDAPAVTEPGADRSRVADDALAQIAPALREQLHETLEKIAWEAFGQVTETVVAQTVERLEKVAWEVVPKLAETLIAEEIRKLKDDA